ncbi:MAG: hypothetical protein NT157_01750 [Candidatus Micrarchaeota archaeon]|nr:hypothetical protein [Candidatus Micrarchaeota archaeon]
MPIHMRKGPKPPVIQMGGEAFFRHELAPSARIISGGERVQERPFSLEPTSNREDAVRHLLSLSGILGDTKLTFSAGGAEVRTNKVRTNISGLSFMFSCMEKQGLGTFTVRAEGPHAEYALNAIDAMVGTNFRLGPSARISEAIRAGDSEMSQISTRVFTDKPFSRRRPVLDMAHGISLTTGHLREQLLTKLKSLELHETEQLMHRPLSQAEFAELVAEPVRRITEKTGLANDIVHAFISNYSGEGVRVKSNINVDIYRSESGKLIFEVEVLGERAPNPEDAAHPFVFRIPVEPGNDFATLVTGKRALPLLELESASFRGLELAVVCLLTEGHKRGYFGQLASALENTVTFPREIKRLADARSSFPMGSLFEFAPVAQEK